GGNRNRLRPSGVKHEEAGSRLPGHSDLQFCLRLAYKVSLFHYEVAGERHTFNPVDEFPGYGNLRNELSLVSETGDHYRNLQAQNALRFDVTVGGFQDYFPRLYSGRHVKFDDFRRH